MHYKFIVATGGTGGHIFPAISLVAALEDKGHKCLVLADKRFLNFKSKMPPLLNYRIISSSSFTGGVFGKIISVLKILTGVVSAMVFILRYNPKMVISFGGYPAFPTMVASILLRKTLMIHEQNSVVGRANRWFLRWADIISVPFKSVGGLENIEKDKIHVVGNPVDRLIAKIGQDSYPAIKKNGKIILLVLGGSQGARILSEVIPEGIGKLSVATRKRLNIVQQCRIEDADRVIKIYRDLSVNCMVASFFTDIATKLQDAHLVIARAGASTVAELIASGRPSVLVPISISNENHQFLNAKVLEDVGAAWIMEEKDFTVSEFGKKLAYLLSNTESLEEAARNARSLFIDSTKNMLELIEKFCANPGKKVARNDL